MDTSSISCAVQQVWAVNERGERTDQVSETYSYACAACGMGWGSGWEVAANHCLTAHSGQPASNGSGGFNDSTSVQTFHAVELESPGE